MHGFLCRSFWNVQFIKVKLWFSQRKKCMDIYVDHLKCTIHQSKTLVFPIICSTKSSHGWLMSNWTHFSSLVGLSSVASWESSNVLGMKWPWRSLILSWSTSLSPCNRTKTMSCIPRSWHEADGDPWTKISLYIFFRAEQVTTPDLPPCESLEINQD